MRCYGADDSGGWGETLVVWSVGVGVGVGVGMMKARLQNLYYQN
jgi:hypothetical protein